MSRITRAPVLDGDLIDANDLDARFLDYQQTDLNQFNTRDAAIDLPQLSNTDFMCLYEDSVTIGKSDLLHAAPVSIAGQTVMPAAVVPIQDGAGTYTPIDFGPTGITIGTDEILRVYWNLSVNPTFTGTPWRAGSLATYTFPEATAGTTVLATNVSCWVLFLQWDITSAALTNWTEVPNQGDFTTNFTGSIYGDTLSDCMSVVPVPAWVERAQAAIDGAVASGSRVSNRIGWRGVSGAWYYPRLAGSQTIYGLRVVAKGVMHSYNLGNVNYLVHDPDASADTALEYTSGTISVIHHTMG